MTPFFLQQAIIKRLEELFKDYRLKKCNTKNEYTSLNIHCQTVPCALDQSPQEDFPYIIVQIDEGTIENETSPQSVTVFLIIGVYDESLDNQGHKDVLSIIAKIYENLATNRLLEDRYYLEYPFKWQLQDDDEYPTYYGGIETHWTTPSVLATDFC